VLLETHRRVLPCGPAAAAIDGVDPVDVSPSCFRRVGMYAAKGGWGTAGPRQWYDGSYVGGLTACPMCHGTFCSASV
jgi:hypothetical protein